MTTRVPFALRYPRQKQITSLGSLSKKAGTEKVNSAGNKKVIHQNNTRYMTQTSPGSNQQVPREYLIELITKVSHVLPCFATVNFRMDRVVKNPIS